MVSWEVWWDEEEGEEKRVALESPGFWVVVREMLAERLWDEAWEGPTGPEGLRGMLAAAARLRPPAPGNLSKKDA